MQTYISKNLRGHWQAETTIETGMPGKVLGLLTMKRSTGTVLTTVQCKTKLHSNVGTIYEPYSDYNAYMPAPYATRCTEKAVREQHARHLATVQSPEYLAQVREHYEAKAA